MYSVHAPTIIMCLINSSKAGYNVIRVEFLCQSLSESQYRLCSIQVFWGSPWDGVGGKDATVGHQIRDSGRNVTTLRAVCLTRPSRMPGARREGAWVSAACSYLLQVRSSHAPLLPDTYIAPLCCLNTFWRPPLLHSDEHAS